MPMHDAVVGPPRGRLIVKRRGHSITRQIPKPVALIDTRERSPFDFSRFPNWIKEEKRQKLKVGDYSVEGMENLLALERKSLSDLMSTLMQHRPRFFKMCEQLAEYRWRALIVEDSYEDSSRHTTKHTIPWLTPTPLRAPSTPWRPASASPSSMPLSTGRWPRKRPQAGCQNTSRTGIWKKTDSAGFCRKETCRGPIALHWLWCLINTSATMACCSTSQSFTIPNVSRLQ
jgi:hypothetical protein